MDVQLQLTKRVLKEFVTQQSRSVGQTRRRRPKTLELQEQLSTQELPKLAEADLAESPPLLLSPGPRSHSQSDPSVTLNQSPRSHSQSDPSVTLNQSPRSHSQSDPQVTLNQSNVAQAVSFPSRTMLMSVTVAMNHITWRLIVWHCLWGSAASRSPSIKIAPFFLVTIYGRSP